MCAGYGGGGGGGQAGCGGLTGISCIKTHSLLSRNACLIRRLVIHKPQLLAQRIVEKSHTECCLYQASVIVAEGGPVSPSLAVSSQCRQAVGRCGTVCRLQDSTLPLALWKQSNVVLVTAEIALSFAGGASGVPVIARLSERGR